MVTIAGINKFEENFDKFTIRPVEFAIKDVLENNSLDISREIIPLCLHKRFPKTSHSGHGFLPTELNSSGPSPGSRERTVLHTEGWEYDKGGLWVELSLPCEGCVKAYKEKFNDERFIYYTMALARRFIISIIEKGKEVTGRNDSYNVLEPAALHYWKRKDTDKVKEMADEERERQKAIKFAIGEYLESGRLMNPGTCMYVKGWVNELPENLANLSRPSAPASELGDREHLMPPPGGWKPSRSPTPE
ncbi:hypothetical protein EYC80_000273 [Monilinia laxa]|uniref:Uncharacterized protein n=1 Tax=Monilinia laxa TaxID=61186 RepID=A0A5N6KA70_MONLA|nr:hypothetical protein EYC80_000273 [Monilinia laxa]